MRSEDAEPAGGQGPASSSPSRDLERITVVGAGRLGTAFAGALRAAGLQVESPLRRDEAPTSGVTVVLLSVCRITRWVRPLGIEPGPLVGHCSGGTTLGSLGNGGFGGAASSLRGCGPIPSSVPLVARTP